MNGRRALQELGGEAGVLALAAKLSAATHQDPVLLRNRRLRAWEVGATPYERHQLARLRAKLIMSVLKGERLPPRRVTLTQRQLDQGAFLLGRVLDDLGLTREAREFLLGVFFFGPLVVFRQAQG